MERAFDRELKELRTMVILLGEITTKSVMLSSELMSGKNLTLGEKIVQLEKESDARETELQKRASTLMALHQPVAGDLRLLLTSMNIGHEMERIADQCINIVQRINESSNLLDTSSLPKELIEMATRVKKMVEDALRAYVNENAELAQEVTGQDMFLDDLKTLVTEKYLDLINKRKIEPVLAVAYILLSRHIEKIGDLAKNVAEEVFYLVRGEFIRHLRFSRPYN